MIARLKAAVRRSDASIAGDVAGLALLFALLFVALAVPASV
ncbi:hypothetical protein [Neotabrizicola sp. VNH66]